MDASVEQGQDDSTSAGKLYIDDHEGAGYWFAEWRDHANRLIRKRIGPSITITKRAAKRRAAEIAGRMIEEYEDNLAQKYNATTRDIWEAAQKASFPREVVAHRVLALVDRIAKSEFDGEGRAGRPGIQLFSERAEISARQVHRIIEDEAYIAVGVGIVDRICTQFELLLDDFIADAFDWAEQRGEWEDRPGTEDSWPFGYYAKTVQPEDDSII